ncbi:MAG: hypothetical protein LUH16_02665 [Clostridiales bacterium]|nr:hypothetical protein [Clostridiales bacterium]
MAHLLSPSAGGMIFFPKCTTFPGKRKTRKPTTPTEQELFPGENFHKLPINISWTPGKNHAIMHTPEREMSLPVGRSRAFCGEMFRLRRKETITREGNRQNRHLQKEKKSHFAHIAHFLKKVRKISILDLIFPAGMIK